MTTADELVGLVSQEGQKQTHRSTRQVSRETGLTQSSIVQIIHRDLCPICLFCVPTRLLPIIVIFLTRYCSDAVEVWWDIQ